MTAGLSTRSAESVRSSADLSPAVILNYRWQGVAWALAIWGCWACLLILSLMGGLSSPILIALSPLVVLELTFLYTGLFIVAHDAMHHSLAPHWPALNNAIGRLALRSYAMFSLAMLSREHHLHHQHSGRPSDPDFHPPGGPSYWRWYFHFMVHYTTWTQLAWMALLFNILWWGFQIPLSRLFVFWMLPAWLSTFQLFTVGTYWPHCDHTAFDDHHRARSLRWNRLTSLLGCYHFGLHWEHHAFPYVPWWKLADVREQLQVET